MTEQEAYVAFNLTENIGSVGVARLAAAANRSVADAWELYDKKASRLDGRPVDWKAEMDKARAAGVAILTPADAEYPRQLLDVASHPLVLYVKGDPGVLSRPSLALVGTRRATAYGLDQAFRFGRDLAANGWAIVSGLALGIDGEAHRGALDAGGIAIGVLGSALNRFYPEQNLPLARDIVKRGGAVVSEFPFGRAPDQQTFPQRNHVVAALARGVLAIEAPAKSGTLITMNLAAEIGRAVMAVPGRVDSRSCAGCLQLIRNGATLVRCAEDVEEEMGGLLRQRVRSDAPAHGAPSRHGAPRAPQGVLRMPSSAAADGECAMEEARVMREVDEEGVAMDELVRRTGLAAAKVNAAAMSLLLKGRVRFLPGDRVALPRNFK